MTTILDEIKKLVDVLPSTVSLDYVEINNLHKEAILVVKTTSSIRQPLISTSIQIDNSYWSVHQVTRNV